MRVWGSSRSEHTETLVLLVHDLGVKFKSFLVREDGLADQREMLDWLVTDMFVHFLTGAAMLTAALRERAGDALLGASVLHVIIKLQ